MKVLSMIKILVLVFMLFACDRNQQDPAVPVFFKGNAAEWIRDGRPLPASDSLFYLDQPAPHFRKEFTAEPAVQTASLFITAAGYYTAFVNGQGIEENVLDPAWTDFSKRIYYSDYDVTSLINEGDNCLGVSLGNGFYNPLPLRKWGRRNLRNDLSVGKPEFIAKLIIHYKNGKSEEIVSDHTWKYAYGPLIRNSVYLGVTYDARKEIQGWNTPGYDDSVWTVAEVGKGTGGTLQAAFFPPVRVTREIKPVGITSPEKGIYMIDMGVNFTGSFDIKMSGNTGDTIIFRFGERIYEDGRLNPMTSVIGQVKRKGVGGAGAPEIAWQTDTYIFGENPDARFTPSFTYHTYRYMEISGLAQKPEISDVVGLFTHTDIPRENSFTSSSELLNSIQEATIRTFRANLVSVQSDCPAREKFGYGGDINATSESFICNFDMQAFYRKTIYDWLDAMNDSCFVDTAPFAGIQYCGLSWESAYLITQYYLYLYYNNTELVRELYGQNKKWMDKAARIHPDGLVDNGLSDHESLEPVPVELTGTGHYLQCARVMATFASVMGDREAERQYEQLSARLKGILKEEFWMKPFTKNINRQTLFSTLLYHGIIPEDEIEAAKDSLVKAVNSGPSGHFSTGIFGTKYVLETLSEYGSPDMVYDIVNSTGYPGWGHMIDHGATTIWETWRESDNTYSNCHPMFGTVTEWYYRWLAGIRPDPDYPGFKEFILAPSVSVGLDSVNCIYHTPYGPIVSAWKKLEGGAFHYNFEIPEGSRARVFLSMDPDDQLEIIRNQEPGYQEKIERLQAGLFTLEAGNYIIKVSPSNTMMGSLDRKNN